MWTRLGAVPRVRAGPSTAAPPPPLRPRVLIPPPACPPARAPATAPGPHPHPALGGLRLAPRVPECGPGRRPILSRHPGPAESDPLGRARHPGDSGSHSCSGSVALARVSPATSPPERPRRRGHAPPSLRVSHTASDTDTQTRSTSPLPRGRAPRPTTQLRLLPEVAGTRSPVPSPGGATSRTQVPLGSRCPGADLHRAARGGGGGGCRASSIRLPAAARETAPRGPLRVAGI